MEILNILIRILYVLTTSLLIPVIILLLILLLWALYETGGFTREWLSRRKSKKVWLNYINLHAQSDDGDSARRDFFTQEKYPSLLAAFARRGRQFQDSQRELNRLAAELEIQAGEYCSRLNLWIRIGPMLGLMGTLIPMGPALMALSTANLESLSKNLVVAFSTTVVGLLIGALFSVVSVTRRHWYVRDMSNIDHLLESVFFKNGTELRE